jgi:hypothetical protein
MQDYLEKMKDYKGKAAYVADNPDTRNNVHLASPSERYSLAVAFVKEFFRVYNIAIVFQRQGKAVKVGPYRDRR